MVTVTFTEKQAKAVLWAIGNFTDGNAREIREMVQNGLTVGEATALLNAESTLQTAMAPRPKRSRAQVVELARLREKALQEYAEDVRKRRKGGR